MTVGFVYLASNELYPNVYKVGHTRFLIRRLKQLSCNVPCNYKYEYFIKVNDCKYVERQIHHILKRKNMKVKNKREFFKGDIDVIINVFKDCQSEDYIENNIEYDIFDFNLYDEFSHYPYYSMYMKILQRY
jgi:T5orf172 domain